MMKIVAIIQARMGSSRLPGKVLMKLPYKSQTPVLAHVVRRAQAAETVDEVVVATSIAEADNPIMEWAGHLGVKAWRGSEQDVLQRFYEAAKDASADHIVRITADCPCLDPGIIDLVVNDHFEKRSDFTSNAIERTFPVGADASLFSFSLLEEAHQQARETYEREHVTPYFYRSHPGRFKVNVYRAPEHYHRPDLRLTLDTKEDYHFLCAIFDYLYALDPLFPLSAVLALLKDKPWLKELNRHALQKLVYTSQTDEVKDLLDYADARGMSRVQSFLKERLGEI